MNDYLVERGASLKLRREGADFVARVTRPQSPLITAHARGRRAWEAIDATVTEFEVRRARA